VNLVPEKRVDRNGKLVTRHVRTPKKLTPAGLLSNLGGALVPKRHPIETRMASLTTNPRFVAMDRKAKRALLETLHPDTMSLLDKHGIKSYEDEAVIPDEIASYCINTGSFALINDVAAYIEDHGTFWGHTYGGFESVTSLLGMQRQNNHLDESLFLKHYSEVDADERAAQHAVVVATRTISIGHLRFSDENEGPISRSINSGLARYIMGNPEKVEQIIKVINTRNINPAGKGLETIKAIVEGEDEIGTTLSQGAL
jgi:hypothetical protein